MAAANLVACPRCGRKQKFRGADALYWCEDCRGQFDGQPEEGGDYFSDPSKRLEVQESRQRKGGKRGR